MFSSGPARCYDGSAWEANMQVDGEQRWLDVVLLAPTENSVDALIACLGEPPRWFRNIELRRRK